MSATRAALAAQVAELRGRGLSHSQVAARLGVSPSYASLLATDPDGAKEAARKDSYRGSCVVCGARTNGSDGPGKAPTHCPRHGNAAEAAARRGQGPVQKALVECLAEGPLRYVEIAAALPITQDHTKVLLHRSVRDGLVERVSRGVYQLPAASQRRSAEDTSPHKEMRH